MVSSILPTVPVNVERLVKRGSSLKARRLPALTEGRRTWTETAADVPGLPFAVVSSRRQRASVSEPIEQPFGRASRLSLHGRFARDAEPSDVLAVMAAVQARGHQCD